MTHVKVCTLKMIGNQPHQQKKRIVYESKRNLIKKNLCTQLNKQHTLQTQCVIWYLHLMQFTQIILYFFLNQNDEQSPYITMWYNKQQPTSLNFFFIYFQHSYIKLTEILSSWHTINRNNILLPIGV
jgi:hypothetical protein